MIKEVGMKSKTMCVVVAVLMLFAMQTPAAFAVGAKEAGASLLLPTTGQAMNGQLGSPKTKIMAGLEVGLITGTAILGGVVGGPVVWATLGPLIANHIWSAADAYKSAQDRRDPMMQTQMLDAQRTLELSRQRRYEREEMAQSSLRDRVQQAGEMAYQR